MLYSLIFKSFCSIIIQVVTLSFSESLSLVERRKKMVKLGGMKFFETFPWKGSRRNGTALIIPLDRSLLTCEHP